MIDVQPAPELRPQFQVIRLHNMLPNVDGAELVRKDLDETGSDILAVRGKGEDRFVNYGFQVWSYADGLTERANVALLAINDRTEPVRLHEDGVPLSISGKIGFAELIVYDPKLRSVYTTILSKSHDAARVNPGSVYAIVAKGRKQAVVYDFCDPPFVDGMETPVDLTPGRALLPGTDQMIPNSFTNVYLRDTQRFLEIGAGSL